MKIKAKNADTTLSFPSGRSLNVSKDGTEVPEDLEKDVTLALAYVGGVEEVKELPAPKKPAPFVKEG